MNVLELIADLQAGGVEIRAEGDRLKIMAARGTITPELRERLLAEKREILANLSMTGFDSLLTVRRKSCRDKYLDPCDLARWLIAQGDPEWCRSVCVYWSASWIERRSRP